MIGSQIALLRQKHGLRQAELAALLNISPSAVGMYEQGRRLPVTKHGGPPVPNFWRFC